MYEHDGSKASEGNEISWYLSHRFAYKNIMVRLQSHYRGMLD